MTDKFKVQKKAYDLSGLKILVVEDFPFMANLMTSMLREFDIGKIVTTCNIREAMALAEQYNMYGPPKSHIDIIITDRISPGGEGLKYLSWLRGHEVQSLRYMPVLFCTTEARAKVVEKIRDKGASEILVKPLSAKKLASRLVYMIDHPRPFIRARKYFGPDRRRKAVDFEGKERRLRKPEDVTVKNEDE